MGILHPVGQHHKKGGLPRPAVNILHGGIIRRRRLGGHPLVGGDAGKALELFRGDILNRNPPLPGQSKNPPHRSLLQAALYIDAFHLPRGAQKLQHRVAPSNNLGFWLVHFPILSPPVRADKFAHRLI